MTYGGEADDADQHEHDTDDVRSRPETLTSVANVRTAPSANNRARRHPAPDTHSLSMRR
jgi:hypothetical protein